MPGNCWWESRPQRADFIRGLARAETASPTSDQAWQSAVQQLRLVAITPRDGAPESCKATQASTFTLKLEAIP
jgi:hypothetical protein